MLNLYLHKKPQGTVSVDIQAPTTGPLVELVPCKGMPEVELKTLHPVV